MPTVTVRLDTRYRSRGDLFPILIRIEHKGHRKEISVGHKVEESFWLDGEVSRKHPEAVQINNAIDTKKAEIKRYLADCDLHGKPIHLNLIGSGRTSYSFSDYLRHRSAQYLAAGRVSIAEKGKVVMAKKVDRY